MKLIPRSRRPIRPVRIGLDGGPSEQTESERHTPVTMDKRGGMARDVRMAGGVVLGLGSRFRLPQVGAEQADMGPGPYALPCRITASMKDSSQRLLGQPMLRLDVDVKSRGQAYRVLEPCTTRFRMRSKAARTVEQDSRFHVAGRGGPKVMLGPSGGTPD